MHTRECSGGGDYYSRAKFKFSSSDFNPVLLCKAEMKEMSFCVTVFWMVGKEYLFKSRKKKKHTVNLLHIIVLPYV